MENMLIPKPDTIPVAWGWFQFLLLLTFPLHLLAMNVMVGSLIFGLVQHISGGEVQKRLAHRIAVVLPLIVAMTVNLGVAPLLFLQVLYGQFNYSSSVLMGAYWILIIPALIIAYYGAYLYDFKFNQLGRAGIIVGAVSCLLFFMIGAMFSNNMLLMLQPEKFSEYFNNMSGTLLIFDNPEYLPRYLHMMLGAMAVGGLFIAMLGRFKSERDMQLADHSLQYGMKIFVVCTVINVVIGVFYLMNIPREKMMIFMGGEIGATAALFAGILLTVGVLVAALKRKLWLTVFLVVFLVYVMAFMRSWLRSGYLHEFFTLDQLQVVPQYSPFILFVVALLIGVAGLFWLWRKGSTVMNQF